MKPEPDITINQQSTISTFWLNTVKAQTWADNHCPDAQIIGKNGMVVEHRYVRDLALRAIEDGLTIRTVA